MYTLTPHETLVLASASPRRLELLQMVGINPVVVPAHIDEEAISASSVSSLVIEIASKKAEKISEIEQYRNCWVLAADTIVVASNEQVLGKPKDAADCEKMLKLLSGATHEVLSAISLQNFSLAISEQHVVRTEVSFRVLSDNEINAYVSTSEPYDKAGGYGVQGLASAFTEKIVGSFTNVVGLPLVETLALLKKIGVIAERIPVSVKP